LFEELTQLNPQTRPSFAAFFSQANENALHDLGVQRVAVPGRNTRSVERKQLQRSRWFKQGHGMRGAPQRAEKTARSRPVPLSSLRRNQTVGRVGRDRRQADKHRNCAGPT
jgi:hypothetical protein